MPIWLTLWGYRKPIAIGLCLITIYFLGYATRVKLDEANEAVRLHDQAVAQKKAQDKADAEANAWEKQLGDLRAANKKLTGRLYAETKKAIYSTCIVPDDGVRLYNESLSGGAAIGSTGGVPRANSP